MKAVQLTQALSSRHAAAVKIQALCRGALTRRYYQARLSKLKVFWASLVMDRLRSSRRPAPTGETEKDQSWRQLHVPQNMRRREDPETGGAVLLPSEVETCWKQYPCPYPGRLLAQKQEPIEATVRKLVLELVGAPIPTNSIEPLVA